MEGVSLVARFAELWLVQGALEADFDHGVLPTQLGTNALTLQTAPEATFVRSSGSRLAVPGSA